MLKPESERRSLKPISIVAAAVLVAIVLIAWFGTETPEARQTLVDYGFHSVYEELNASREDLTIIEDPFTLSEFGGAASRREILEQVWRDRVVPELVR